jgi:hypothetical protein
MVNDIVLHIDHLCNHTHTMFSHYSSNDGKKKAIQLIAVKMSRIIRNLLIKNIIVCNRHCIDKKY